MNIYDVFLKSYRTNPNGPPKPKTLSDQCTTQAGTVPWFVNDDRMLVCDTTSGSKKLNTLADVLCDVTKSRGVTEVRVVEHGLQPKMKAMFPKQLRKHVIDRYS